MINSHRFSHNASISHYGNWEGSHLIKLNSIQATIDISFYNQRLTILEYNSFSSQGISELSQFLSRISIKLGLNKIWGKIPSCDSEKFVEYGFTSEASIGSYFLNDDAIICSKFFNNRNISKTPHINKEIIQAISSAPPKNNTDLKDGYHYKLADPIELRALSRLFNRVFTTYPYPVFNENYLYSTLDHTIYGLIYNKQKHIAAVASAETDQLHKNAEMTDFATLPQERGQGLASIILHNLESYLKSRNYRCVYSIARSTSFSMNAVFKSAGYSYTGTLINNCNIAGGLEDMNVWYKLL
ncbi:MAG TPA: putative beta-lysine N-acetyltransferase [Syntrophomonadaceae bacterium]|nr:putative beta-lysine N-acetyltransferase [Syntrophomonadaceae bacterium]HQD91448.1 putative beta-lysine N-acetyltransferase [Syntrophomonadaceae bacterium]